MMGKENTATFIGHKECYRLNPEDVREEIRKLIENGVTVFLSGGMGTFDWMCARIVFELKKTSPHISSYLVIPYLSFNILEKKYFDSIVYPEGFEKYHFKAAIPARNKYLVDNSAYSLCYVTHDWSGAAQTLKKAVKKGLTVINLGEKMVDRIYLETEVIYKKTFLEKSIDEIEFSMIEQKDKSKKHMTFDEIINEIFREIAYVLLPERAKTAEAFVKTAIEISETYELDKIVKHHSHISVNYYFNSTGCMGFLRKVIMFADDIEFFTNTKGYDIVMSIDHYTHAVIRDGKRIKP